MRWRTTKPSSRELLRGQHVPRMPSRRWGGRVVLLLLLAALVALFCWRDERLLQAMQRVERLTSENQHLQAELGRQQLRQHEAESAQQQLVTRNAELSAEIKRLKTELAFFRQQKP